MKENNNLSLSDLSDSTILRENESLLSLLLKDHTTGRNIKWGTDSYINHGYSFRDDQEIKIDLITGWYEGFIRPRVDKDIDIQLERQRNRAEVFTPSWVIKLQVDAALKDMEELSLVDFIKTKWLEITCGEAPYMVNRYDMETGEVIPLKERSGFIDVKFKKLNEEIESEEEWLKLAIEIYKASYGYEYQGDSLLLARENLILTFVDNYFYMFGAFPKEKILLEITKIISLNVFQMDGLTYEIPYSVGGFEEFGIQLNLFEEVETKEVLNPKLAKLKLWNENKLIEFKDLLERNDADMKFDVVIGNPPYQAEAVGDNKTYLKSIYPIFMDSAFEIGEKVCMVTPARFLFNAGSNKKWNQKMLNDEFFKVLDYFENSSEVFTNVDIKGGIAVTYRDRSQKVEPIKTFVPYPEMRSVLSKIDYDLKRYGSIESISYSPSAYRLSDKGLKAFEDDPYIKNKNKDRRLESNIFDKAPAVFIKDSNKLEKKNLCNYRKLYGLLNSKRVYRFVLEEYIDYPNNFKSFKVIVPKANGSGNFGEVLGSPVVIGSNEGHTRTFLSIGTFEKKEAANNCLSYIKTKFLRALLSTLKTTQNTYTNVWKNIPVQNFTSDSDINWTKSIPEIDQQLYKKYDLSQEEINFIENNVKEME